MSRRKRILIVDDERNVVLGLSRKVPFDELGMELAGTAENGRDALDFIESQPVDIVITDILMPELDGLELIAAAADLPQRPRFIILSGHGEFNFARRAMSFGVRHYVLKPSRIQDIVGALKELNEEIDHTEAIGEDSQAYPTGLVREGLVEAMVTGTPLSHADQLAALRALDIDPETTVVRALVVDLGDPATTQLTGAARIIVERTLSGARVLGSHASATGIVFLVLPDGDDPPSGLEGLSVALRKLGTRKRAIGFTPSEPVESIANPVSAALRSFVGSFYVPSEYVGPLDGDATETDDDALSGEHGVEADLGIAILAGDESAVQAAVDRLLDDAAHRRVEHHAFLARVQSVLSDVARRIGGAEAESAADRIERVSSARDIDQFRALMVPITTSLARLAHQLHQTPHLRIVAGVKESVRQRFAEPGLSLKRIATTDVYGNADYLGRVFRSVTGIGFKEYLRDIRMREAASILVEFSTLSVGEVARRVGFGENSHYFSSSFRDYSGCTPNEYRRRRPADASRQK